MTYSQYLAGLKVGDTVYVIGKSGVVEGAPKVAKIDGDYLTLSIGVLDFGRFDRRDGRNDTRLTVIATPAEVAEIEARKGAEAKRVDGELARRQAAMERIADALPSLRSILSLEKLEALADAAEESASTGLDFMPDAAKE